MFFKKKKPKLDPKVRFQNRQFNQKLQQARTFKRNARPVPEGAFSKFLTRVKLGSAWRQVGLALLVLAILYIVYFPNFLTLQSIQIDGVSDSDRANIEASLRDNLAKVPFYNPQRNIIFLSKARINAVLASFPQIYTIDKVDKNFVKKSLHIVVTPKQDRFLVRSKDKAYIVYNDGSIKTELGNDLSVWDTISDQRLIKLDIPASIITKNNQFLSPDLVTYIFSLVNELKGITGSKLVYLNIPLTSEKKQPISPPVDPLITNEQESTNGNLDSTPVVQQPDPVDQLVSEENPEESKVVEIHTPIALEELNLYFQKGDQVGKFFKVLIDPTENSKELVQRLNLLLSQTTPERYTNLSYIDLRIKNRAFVCLIGAACVR